MKNLSSMLSNKKKNLKRNRLSKENKSDNKVFKRTLMPLRIKFRTFCSK